MCPVVNSGFHLSYYPRYQLQFGPLFCPFCPKQNTLLMRKHLNFAYFSKRSFLALRNACAAEQHLVLLHIPRNILVDEQSQRRLSLGSKVTPAKKENMRQRSNSPKCASWTSPSEVSGKKIRNDTQELIRSENMDRRSVGALTLLR